MNRRDDRFAQDERQQANTPDSVHPIGDVLDELLAQYQRRFPELHLTMVETALVPA